MQDDFELPTAMLRGPGSAQCEAGTGSVVLLGLAVSRAGCSHHDPAQRTLVSGQQQHTGSSVQHYLCPCVLPLICSVKVNVAHGLGSFQLEGIAHSFAFPTYQCSHLGTIESCPPTQQLQEMPCVQDKTPLACSAQLCAPQQRGWLWSLSPQCPAPGLGEQHHSCAVGKFTDNS